MGERFRYDRFLTMTLHQISTNCSVHGMDIALMTMEVAINNIPVARTHVLPIIFIALLYCFYTWVVHAIPYNGQYVMFLQKKT